jgi:hypothetical protein
MRHFKILPSGIIKGGFFLYDLSPDAGLLTYKTSLEAKKWGIGKRFDADGSQKIDPKQIESATYSVVGAKIEFANLKGVVTELRGNIAVAKISMTDVEASGTAQFDLSGKYVALEHLVADGRVKVPVLGKVEFRLILEKTTKNFIGTLAKRDVVWPSPEQPKDGKDGEVQQEKP